MKGRADRGEGVGERVVGREDGDVEGVVLELALCQLHCCANREVTDKTKQKNLHFALSRPDRQWTGWRSPCLSLPAALFFELAKLAVVLKVDVGCSTVTSTH